MANIKRNQTLLKGEGANQHTLYGKFKTEDTLEPFAEIMVLTDSELRHEKPDTSFAEHNTLRVDSGEWVMGKQVEYNPFSGNISQVWD